MADDKWVNKQPGKKQPTTNLKYPDRNLLTILNEKVPK